MDEKILNEAKVYIDNITTLNSSKAFLRGFICGLKGIVEEQELDMQIAYELDVPNFKSGYFDGIKFYAERNEEKLNAMLQYANAKFENNDIQKNTNPVQSLLSNLQTILNTNNQFIDLNKIDEKVSNQDLTRIDPKDIMDETEKLHNEALDISKQIKDLNFPTLNPLVESTKTPKKDSEKLKEYSDELDKLLEEAKGNRNIDDILKGE